MSKKIIALVLVLVLILSTNLVGGISLATATDENSMNNLSDSYGYVNFYGDLEGKGISFIDGISLGITSTKDPLYFEKISLDGLDGRKQYSSNSTYITVDDSFYQKGDTEFLVNICYYDFGPSEGSYYFEYPQITEALKSKCL